MPKDELKEMSTDTWSWFKISELINAKGIKSNRIDQLFLKSVAEFTSKLSWILIAVFYGNL